MKKATAAWIRKAEDDLEMAKELHASARPHHDGVCFHSQQAAEKFLKALMEELGLSIPKTHLLLDLWELLLPHHASLRRLRRGLHMLTRFAVTIRYPGDHARKRQAEAALRWASRVRDLARLILGIRPAGPRPKTSG